jgi:hypothetical protein
MSTSAKHLVDRPVGAVLHAIKNPIGTVSYGIGLVRGVAASLVRAASGGGGPAHAEWIAPPEPVSSEALEGDLPEESGVLLGEHVEPAPERAPGDPGEAFVTEPSAVSRESAHGGSASVDEQIDDWYDELDAPGPPEGVVASLEFGDRNVRRQTD